MNKTDKNFFAVPDTPEKSRNYSQRIALLGMLTAVAVALSFFEGFIPYIPFLPPGAKLGLSNIITMYAAVCIGLPSALLIALLKSLFVLSIRGFTAFLMSVAGGLFSTVVMWLFCRLRQFGFGYLGIGMAGAAAHNIAQLGVSMLLTSTAELIVYLPPLLVFSIISGSVSGILLKIIMPTVEKIKRF